LYVTPVITSPVAAKAPTTPITRALSLPDVVCEYVKDVPLVFAVTYAPNAIGIN